MKRKQRRLGKAFFLASYQGQAVSYWLLLSLCTAGLFLPSLFIHFAAAVYDTTLYTARRLSNPTFYSNYHFVAMMEVKDMAEHGNSYFHEAGFKGPDEVRIDERSDIEGVMNYDIIDDLGEFYNARGRAFDGITAYTERNYRMMFLREGRLSTKAERAQGAKVALLGLFCPVDVGERLQIYGEDFIAIGRVADFQSGVIIPYQAMIELVPYLHARHRFSCWGDYQEALPKIEAFHANHPGPNNYHYERNVEDYRARRLYFWPSYLQNSKRIWKRGGAALIFGLALMSLLVLTSIGQKRGYYALHRSVGLSKRRQFFLIVSEVLCLFIPASLLALFLLHALRKHLPSDFFYLKTRNAPLWTLLFAMALSLMIGGLAARRVMRETIADSLREGI